jgi:hypothetical protein
VKGLLDEVPPGELYDAAWECAGVRGGDSDTRSDAREALRKLVGRRDRVLVPRMLETLGNLGTRDGSDLASAFGSLKPPVKEAVPVLTDLVDSRDDSTRKAAVHALGDMGEAALSAVPRLVDALAFDRDQETREAAAMTLGEIGPKCAKAAVPALAKAAREDKWPKVRTASITALGEMGPAAKEAIPVLRAALKDPDGWISGAAMRALFRVEPDAKEEVAAIADTTRPAQEGSLYDDLSRLKAVLSAKVPEVWDLNIHEDSAFATAPCGAAGGERCQFKYEGGAVTGPDEASGDCDKKIPLAKVDFSVVPSLVKQAPGLLGAPSGKVDLVSLSGGVFCKGPGWYVHVKDAGMVEFKLNGKVDKVRKF